MKTNQKDPFEQPDFLLAEVPIKDGSPTDDRLWIYCHKTFSLIEFILKEEFSERKFIGTQAPFVYVDLDGYKEDWIGVYVQNNCALVGADQNDNLKAAWAFLEAYFKWEEMEDDNN
ncbi:hypothetical protein [Flavobacterium sp. JP2137]|uniref:hypothetical protein n=1 Tax=Flavobacterium sp. JP2137 TaxID=3414510 RepID=UPI003D2FA81B